MDVKQQFYNGLIQLVVYSFVPFVWWLCTKGKEKGFFTYWIGIKKVLIANKKRFIKIIILISIISTGLIYYYIPLSTSVSIIDNISISTMGYKSILIILIYSFLTTGLCEEILFRGFLCKRLAEKTCFKFANFMQGLLFGEIHGCIAYFIMGREIALIVLGLTTIYGWLLGYLNEKLSDGSIVPSWIMHGLTNGISLIFKII